MTDKTVCDELGAAHVSSGAGVLSWHCWRQLGKEAFPGTGVTRNQELEALKRELAQTKKERDFSKEAAAYFAKQPT